MLIPSTDVKAMPSWVDEILLIMTVLPSATTIPRWEQPRASLDNLDRRAMVLPSRRCVVCILSSRSTMMAGWRCSSMPPVSTRTDQRFTILDRCSWRCPSSEPGRRTSEYYSKPHPVVSAWFPSLIALSSSHLFLRL